MAPQYFIAWAVGAGVALPVIWLIAYWTLLKGNPGLIHTVMAVGHLDKVLLAIWPSSILLAADPEDRSVAIPIVSMAVNAALYGSLGWLVWFGVYKNRIVLVVTILLILVGWHYLFSWYAGR